MNFGLQTDIISQRINTDSVMEIELERERTLTIR